MNRRWNFLFVVPLITALVAYVLTQRLLFTALGFVVGYLLMEGLRFVFLPPYLHRAARRYQKGDLEAALELSQRAIEARPDRWEPYYLQALIQFSGSELDRAELSASKAIDLHSEEAVAHQVLGQILFAQGRYDEAKESFLAAIDNGGREGIHQFHVAAASFRLGQWSEAVPRLELALRLGIDNRQLTLLATFFIAECLKQLGEEEAAEDYYAQLLRYSKELANLQQDLHIVPDYPERTALRKDVDAIAQLVHTERSP